MRSRTLRGPRASSLVPAGVLVAAMLGLHASASARLAVPDEEPVPGAPADPPAPSEPAPSGPAPSEPAPSEPAPDEAPPSDAGADPELHGDEEGDEEILVGTTGARSREEVEREEERRLDEEADRVPPPPDPEWRLRAGVGVALPLNGASTPFLRLHQDVEWQPASIAPFIFGLGGAEYLLGGTLGSAGARFGLATYFCGDSVVRCQGALVVVVGALFGQNLLAFDIGGEGDVRFQFGALELSVRVGFGGGGGLNFVHGGLGVGAAF